MTIRSCIFSLLCIGFLSCNSQLDKKPAASGNPGRGCANPEKIRVAREDVYDLSGFFGEGNGDPYALFDENDFVDPRNESRFASNYIPVTDPQPRNHPAIYFASNRGSRIVVDLKTAYRVSEIYLYDRSSIADSVWLYTGNMAGWKLKASFVTSASPGERGWKKFGIADSTAFVMIRFNSYNENISEMVLYGCALQPVPPPEPTAYSGVRLPKKTMDHFLGVNYIMLEDPQWIQPFHYSRLYNFALDYDNDTRHSWPDISYNMLHYGIWNNAAGAYEYDMAKLKKLNDGNIWYSIRGVNQDMTNKGLSDKDRPVTHPGMDPESPMSYARHASMMWHIAAFFGNTAVDTNLLRLSFQPKRSGLGLMSVFENGNEEDAWWEGNKYCNPVEYFAQSSADFDGDEGRLGKYAGIVQADPGSKLMMSGMIELDTNRLRIYSFLARSVRKDKKFPWQGGIQYHHYSHRGKKGISPEEDSLRWKLSRVRDASYRMQPGIECFLGENGYDKSQDSWQNTPVIPGLNTAQSQGIFIIRSINATAFSGFDAYILYWLRDYNPPDDKRVFMTSGVIGPADGGGLKAYPGWFYISTFVNRLAAYTADSIISEKGNVWIYQYRNQLHPDSLAWFVYSATGNGTRMNNYRLNLPASASGAVQEIYFADDNKTGTSTSKQISDHAVSVTVEEKPKLIMFKAGS